MRILVTGGAGFIGSNFLNLMVPRYPEDTFINLDALTYAGNLANLTAIEQAPNYRYVKGSITDHALVESLFAQGLDGVIHFAAESHVDRSVENPGLFVETNVEGTHNLLAAARRHGVGKYVQVSTDEVFGSLGAEGYFTETTPFAPNSPYAASKAAADHLVVAYGHTFGLAYNITHCSNNYGPYQFPEKMIPLMIQNALEDKPLPVYGDGSNVRDWLYVDDHCQAIDLVFRKGKPGECYNVGGHNEWNNLDLIKLILQTINKPESLITFVKDRPGHDFRYAIDPAKIGQDLGWQPTVMFPQGIQRTIEWYVTHQEWMQQVRSGEYEQYYQRMYGNR